MLVTCADQCPRWLGLKFQSFLLTLLMHGRGQHHLLPLTLARRLRQHHLLRYPPDLRHHCGYHTARRIAHDASTSTLL